MIEAFQLMEIPSLPDEIRRSALDGHLVLFIGAGVSRLVGLPSWNELALLVLEDIRYKGLLNYADLEQLKKLDPKKQLTIAQLKAREKGYEIDFAKYLISEENEKGVYQYLNDIGCSCVTTNYDSLIEPRIIPKTDGSTTKATINRIFRKEKFLVADLDSPGTVVHLHGFKDEQSTMVITTKDYLEHYECEEVQYFLTELFKRKTVVFIGYGLEEAEILEHILRKGRVKDTQVKMRFCLQGFFKNEEPLYRMLYQYYLTSFGIVLIGFTRDSNDYNQLETIIKEWSYGIKVKSKALVEDLDFMEEVLSGT